MLTRGRKYALGIVTGMILTVPTVGTAIADENGTTADRSSPDAAQEAESKASENRPVVIDAPGVGFDASRVAVAKFSSQPEYSAPGERGNIPEEEWDSYVAQGPFSELANRLEMQYPKQFLRAIWSPTETQTFLFQDSPPAEVAEQIADLSGEKEIRHGYPVNFHDLEAQTRAVGAALDGTVVTAFTTRFDAESASLVIDAEPSSGVIDSETRRRVRASVERTLSAWGSRPSVARVEVRFDQGVGVERETVAQGGRLGDEISGALQCTFGFTAKRNGNAGLVTAGHCPDDLAYTGTQGVLSTNPATAGRTDTDLQFHRVLAGHATNKQFRATGYAGTHDRTVENVGNGAAGTTVCNWGVESEYGCTTIASVNQCYRDSRLLPSNQICGVDYTQDAITSPGDSGGPWFVGNAARGIHKGRVEDGNGTPLYSIFHRIGWVESKLGVNIREN